MEPDQLVRSGASSVSTCATPSERDEREYVINSTVRGHAGGVVGVLRTGCLLGRCVPRATLVEADHAYVWPAAGGIAVAGPTADNMEQLGTSRVSTSSCKDIKTIKLWWMTRLVCCLSRNTRPTDQLGVHPFAQGQGDIAVFSAIYRSSASFTTCSWLAAIMAPRRTRYIVHPH